MSKRIKEAASESRRGRPCVYDARTMQIVRAAFPEAKSARQQLEIAHYLTALNAVKGRQEFAWLLDGWTGDGIPPAGVRFRAGILARLGRLQDEDLIRVCAAEVCRHRPPVRQTQAVIDSVLMRLIEAETAPGDGAPSPTTIEEVQP